MVVLACDRAPPVATSDAVPLTSASASATPTPTTIAAKKCLPVVAADCGCVYSCGAGTETSAGKWSVVHPFWAPTALDAKIAPWCVGGDCTDAFHAQIVCSGICSPKPADHTCHFEGDRCVSAQKP